MQKATNAQRKVTYDIKKYNNNYKFVLLKETYIIILISSLYSIKNKKNSNDII